MTPNAPESSPNSSARKVRKAVLPAAGLGTRFLPATKAQPKEMLAVVDKPQIQYVAEECVASGIERIIIVTGRGKSAIEHHFDASPFLEAFLEKHGKRQSTKRRTQMWGSPRAMFGRRQFSSVWSAPSPVRETRFSSPTACGLWRKSRACGLTSTRAFRTMPATNSDS